MRVVVLLALVLAVAACPGRLPDVTTVADAGVVTPPVEAKPDVACPGAPGCTVATDDTLFAGAAVRDITPNKYEVARTTYLNTDDPNKCMPETPVQTGTTRRCGELNLRIFDDCGHDAICFDDPAYPGPDADGSEADGKLDDFFFDCGTDRICPDNVPETGEQATDGIDNDGDGLVDGEDVAYTGPDADGTEGDGIFQGVWLAGFDNNRPMQGFKDPLETRAVVLRQGNSTLALVAVDSIGLLYTEELEIRRRVEAARPGAVDLLILQATHSHEVPDTVGQWGFIDPFQGEVPPATGRDPAFIERMRQGSADAVIDAIDHLTAVNVKAGDTHTGVEGYMHDSRDPQIFNDTLTAVALDDVATGNTVATLVNYAQHPESLDDHNNFVSGDYAYRMRKVIEQGLPATSLYPEHTGRGGVAIFLEGALGGLINPDYFVIHGRDGTDFDPDVNSYARTDGYGELLAEHAFAALAAAVPFDHPKLRFSTISFKVPVDNQIFHVGIVKNWFDRETFDFDPNEAIGPNNLPHLLTEVSLIHLGDLGIITGPGEMFPETFVGFDPAQSFGRPQVDPNNPNPPDLSKAPKDPPLRDRLGTRYAFPMGLAHDELGYLVPPYDFKLSDSQPWIEQAIGDHYEETQSVGPAIVPLMNQAMDVLFKFDAVQAAQ